MAKKVTVEFLITDQDWDKYVARGLKERFSPLPDLAERVARLLSTEINGKVEVVGVLLHNVAGRWVSTPVWNKKK